MYFFRHLRWILLIDPAQLQGSSRGFVRVYSFSMQILQGDLDLSTSSSDSASLWTRRATRRTVRPSLRCSPSASSRGLLAGTTAQRLRAEFACRTAAPSSSTASR
jgi:hypothetical protein